MDDVNLIGVDDLAQLLGVRPRTIWRWVNDGKIPAVRPTQKILRFDRDAVLSATAVQPLRTGSNETINRKGVVQ